MPEPEKAKHISKCLELAMLLEVSVTKPGNVTFTKGFMDTRVEHFLASAVAAESWFEEAAQRGIAVSENRLSIGSIEMGQIIKKCVTDINAWQKGGNTVLGTVILLVPVAVAAGMTPTKKNMSFDFSKLRTNLRFAVESTTADDAVHLYEAIAVAKPSGLGSISNLDVHDPASKKRILQENVSLYKVFKIAAGYDAICSEWVKNYPLTFDLAYPYLLKELKRGTLNTAVVHTFLRILSEHSDTFIVRKAGIEKAREISYDARKILKLGGEETTKGKQSILEFDKKLRNFGNIYNPGTTADLTAAALALCTLNGYRP
jgi:triphosphoribosyl-dephospho-CoA synthase